MGESFPATTYTKSEIRWISDLVKEDPNTPKVKLNAGFNGTTQNMRNFRVTLFFSSKRLTEK